MQCCHLSGILIIPEMFVEHAVPSLFTVVARQDRVWHLLPMPLREDAQGSGDESLPAHGQQGGAEWKL